jgi:hypothetical protein
MVRRPSKSKIIKILGNALLGNAIRQYASWDRDLGNAVLGTQSWKRKTGNAKLTTQNLGTIVLL